MPPAPAIVPVIHPTVARAPRLRLDAFVPTVNDSRSGQAHILERS